MPSLRRPGSPCFSAIRRCGADTTQQQIFNAIRGRSKVEPRPETLRAARAVGGEKALQQAEEECLADAEARSRRRERESERREELDQEYISNFAARVRALFPRCPAERELVIAEHACQKYSGRVGRSASAKNLDENAILLAVIAHIRHTETDYDELLSQGYERQLARDEVKGDIEKVLRQWLAPG